MNKENATWENREKVASTSQGERPQEKPNLQTLWSWTFSLRNYKKINFSWLSHLVFGILLWKSYYTNTVASSHCSNISLVIQPGRNITQASTTSSRQTHPMVPFSPSRLHSHVQVLLIPFVFQLSIVGYLPKWQASSYIIVDYLSIVSNSHSLILWFCIHVWVLLSLHLDFYTVHQPGLL